jgi:hypothetical protein
LPAPARPPAYLRARSRPLSPDDDFADLSGSTSVLRAVTVTLTPLVARMSPQELANAAWAVAHLADGTLAFSKRVAHELLRRARYFGLADFSAQATQRRSA